jgi:hypothetical protein
MEVSFRRHYQLQSVHQETSFLELWARTRMSRTNYHIDKTNTPSVEALIDAFGARDTEHEESIRAALSLHEHAFVLRVDYVSRPNITPLEDAFTFDAATQELILFNDEPSTLVDAILEMAMYLHGFDTNLQSADEWKPQFTIGAWHYVRRGLKERLNINPQTSWRVALEVETVERFDSNTFESMIFLSGHPEVEVVFPSGTNSLITWTYKRLSRIMEATAFNVDLDDHAVFNRRLKSALALVEAELMPGERSIFDELLGPDGFNDRFFTSELD